MLLSNSLLLLQEGADDSWSSIGGNWGSIGGCSIGGHGRCVRRRAVHGGCVCGRGRVVSGVGGGQAGGRVGGHRSCIGSCIGGCGGIRGCIGRCRGISGHWWGQEASLGDGEAESQADEELKSQEIKGLEIEVRHWSCYLLSCCWFGMNGQRLMLLAN